MKKVIFAILIVLTKTSLADGVDKIHIYLNNKFLKTVTEGGHDTISVDFHPGDTLKFFSWTDWGGQFNATMDIKDNSNVLISKPNRLNDKQYGAKFYYIIDSKTIYKNLNAILDYHSSQLKPWSFATITLKHLLEQNNKNDSLNYDYAFLRFQARTSDNKLDVSFTNGGYVNLIQALKLDTGMVLNKPYFEDNYIFKGFNYLDKKGYEFISSSSYRHSELIVIREYIFRKKKK